MTDFIANIDPLKKSVSQSLLKKYEENNLLQNKNLKDAMSKVNDLNRTHGIVQRGGKKYTEVFVRVEAFRMAFGTSYGISTNILQNDGKCVVVQAKITDPNGFVIGSGIAEEIRGSGHVNKTSAIENCETSAIGRALASLGLHGGTYASINEMDGVDRKSQAIQKTSSPKIKSQPPQQQTNGGL